MCMTRTQWYGLIVSLGKQNSMASALKPWTAEEEAVLYQWYETKGSDFCDAIIAQRTGCRRGNRNVMQKAWKMGIRYKGPRRGVFKPGHETFNKGKKMPAEVKAKVEKTMFKKGNLPHNTKSKGDDISIRIDNRGRKILHIRLGIGKWEYLSRHTWRSFYGEIPDGYCVAHKDGDTMNCRIENLELISRAETARRNYSRDKFLAWHSELMDEYVYRYQVRYRHLEGIDFETAKANGLIDIWRAEIQLKRKLLTVKKSNNNENRNKKSTR